MAALFEWNADHYRHLKWNLKWIWILPKADGSAHLEPGTVRGFCLLKKKVWVSFQLMSRVHLRPALYFQCCETTSVGNWPDISLKNECFYEYVWLEEWWLMHDWTHGMRLYCPLVVTGSKHWNEVDSRASLDYFDFVWIINGKTFIWFVNICRGQLKLPLLWHLLKVQLVKYSKVKEMES